MSAHSGENGGRGPAEVDFSTARDPLALFQAWFEAARQSEPEDPEAMALATVDETGMPNVRMVLLKGADARGFVFFTNLTSTKGRELQTNPKAALCFHWKSLHRQVRIRGTVSVVSDAEADAYFASRPRGSRIGAWASKQSAPLESRFALEKRVASYGAKYAVGPVPRPPFWSGFRLEPLEMEFWRAGAFRLHDRLVFRREGTKAPWTRTRLYP